MPRRADWPENPNYRPAATADPRCLCGCGQPVKRIGQSYRNYGRHGPVRKGQPANYVAGRNPKNDEQAAASRAAGNIDIDEFRATIARLMSKYGTTTAMANAAGLPRTALYQLMHDPRRKTVTRAWASKFLARLAGLATEPWPHEIAEVERLNRARRYLATADAQSEARLRHLNSKESL